MEPRTLPPVKEEHSLDPRGSVQLPQTLRELLDIRGYDRRHASVAAAIGVSRSALSQYLSGRAQPGLETLIRLAKFLDTSLDYLVFGSETVRREAIDPGPIARYVDTALGNLQRRSAEQAMLVGRISQALASRIDEVAEELATNLAERPAAGSFTESEVFALEHYSLEVRSVSTTFKNDVVDVGGEVAAAGRLTRLVAKNLSLGRTYRFLLPKPTRPWSTLIQAYRDILAQNGADGEALAGRLLIRELPWSVPVDLALYHLDLQGLRLADPLLYEVCRDAISPDGWIGFVLPTSHGTDLNGLLDSEHLDSAARWFDAMWDLTSADPS